METYSVDQMPPEGITVIPPEGGWQPDHIYIVEVSVDHENPIHRALLHVGFLNDDDTLGSYSEVWCNTYDEASKPQEFIYMKAIKGLGALEE